MKTARFIIVTPAHNEEAFIGKTLESMIRQTVRPIRWIIVDDASTDRTAAIAARFVAEHSFIQLVQVQRPTGRDFGNKVRAFDRGLAEAAGLDYAYIGNLDADISLDADYFEKLLKRFELLPGLGIAGGMVSSCINGTFVSQEVSLDSVAGAVQLFRRECFEQIGGYVPLPFGGIDAAAEITARAKGWQVRTFPELRVLEHRQTGTAGASPVRARIREGQRLYSLGYSASFFFLRCVYRSMESPRIIGSMAALGAFLTSWFRRARIVLPADVVAHLRAEQRKKVCRLWQWNARWNVRNEVAERVN